MFPQWNRKHPPQPKSRRPPHHLCAISPLARGLEGPCPSPPEQRTGRTSSRRGDELPSCDTVHCLFALARWLGQNDQLRGRAAVREMWPGRLRRSGLPIRAVSRPTGWTVIVSDARVSDRSWERSAVSSVHGAASVSRNVLQMSLTFWDSAVRRRLPWVPARRVG